MLYRFIFVCQGGELEAKACLLAASLNTNLKCDFELVAAIPDGQNVQRPSATTIAFLHSINVATEPIKNPLSSDYLIGHKLACFQLESNAGKTIFLDSDMLCLRPFIHEARFEDFSFNAKLEDWHHHHHSHWEVMHRHFNLPQPEFNHRSTVFDEPMPLYFNAGWLAVDQNAASAFAEQWIEVARVLDASNLVPRLRPNLDQLSLPIAVTRCALRIDLLSEKYNFPAELRSLDHVRLPIFCHYHDPHMILCDSLLSGKVINYSHIYPGLGDVLLETKSPVWNAILNSSS